MACTIQMCAAGPQSIAARRSIVEAVLHTVTVVVIMASEYDMRVLVCHQHTVINSNLNAATACCNQLPPDTADNWIIHW
jgi:hypothetical protein